MADKEVKIAFRTAAELAAAKELLVDMTAVLESQKEVTASVEEHGEASEETAKALDKYLKNVEKIDKAISSSGLSLDDFNAAAEKLVVGMADTDENAAKLAGQLDLVGGEGKKAGDKLSDELGRGAVTAARLLQGLASGGIAPLLSQIPQLAKLLGAGAGLAGGIAAAAAAASIFIPKLLGVAEAERKAADAAAELKEKTDALAEVLESEKVDAYNAAAQAAVESLGREIAALEKENDAIDANIAKLRARERVALSETDAASAQALLDVDRREALGEQGRGIEGEVGISAGEATRQRADIRAAAAQKVLDIQKEINNAIKDEELLRRAAAKRLVDVAGANLQRTQELKAERLKQARRDELDASQRIKEAQEREEAALEAVRKSTGAGPGGGSSDPEAVAALTAARRDLAQAESDLADATARRGGLTVSEIAAEMKALNDLNAILEKEKKNLDDLVQSQVKLLEKMELEEKTRQRILDITTKTKKERADFTATGQDERDATDETAREAARLDKAAKGLKDFDEKVSDFGERLGPALGDLAARLERVTGNVGVATDEVQRNIVKLAEEGATGAEFVALGESLTEAINLMGQNRAQLREELRLLKEGIDKQIENIRNTIANRG